MQCLKNFSQKTGADISFPLSSKTVIDFTGWCKIAKKLKPSTIRSYISSIAMAHKLRNLDHSNCTNFISKQMLKGMENLDFYETRTKKSRKVMTLPLLKLAGSEISRMGWPPESKQVIWTILTTAFFGSFRMGEILSKSEKSFNPAEDLLWEDITFRDDNSILIRIKVPKNRKIDGEYIDLFQFRGHQCCPVASLKKLRKMCFKKGMEKYPVFMLKNSKLVTPKEINKILPQLLQRYMGSSANEYLGHSLRPALASALANDPELASDSEVRKWGRWCSNSYLLYCHLKIEQKRFLFGKITNVLNKQ